MAKEIDLDKETKTGQEKHKKARSLTVTLTIAFWVLCQAVLIIAISSEMYFEFQNQQKSTVSEQQLIAQNAAKTVSGFVQEQFSVLEIAGRLTSPIEASLEGQEQILGNILGFRPAFRQLILLNKENQELTRVSRISKQAAGELAEQLKDDILSQTKEGKKYVSPVYINEITSEPMIILAVPATNALGDFQGTLVAETNLKFMWDLVDGIKIGVKGAAYVVDRQGNLIAFGDVSRVLKGDNLANLREVSEFINNEELVARADISKGIQGTNVISTFVPLGTPDWAVVVELPITEAYQAIIQLLIFSVFILILSFILALVAGLFLSKKITRPIINLRDAAREISKGKLDTKIEIKSRNEIGELAVDFNTMAVRLSAYTQQLKDYAKELENRVAARTAELDKKVKELVETNAELGKAESAMVNLIEDARLLEASLKEERDRAKAIITSMGEGLIVVDKENRTLLINPMAEKFLGVSLDKIRNQDIREAVPFYYGDLKVDIKDHPITKTIKTGEATIIRLEDNLYFQTAAGRKFAVIMVVAPLLGNGVTGAVIMFRDASEEKQLDEAKTGFISVASHQLRTPLTSMRWFSEMLMSGDAGKITDKQKHFVERIYQGIDRMIALINLLLQIARVEAGRLKIKPVPVDLKNITRGVLVTLKTNLDEKSQKVVIKSEPKEFPSILMDQEVVWQVIQNLLSNASRYSPEKSTITVSIIKKNDVAEYSVKDEGIGIPKEYQDRIFEKFFRAENALKMVPTGSGLGLSLVKSLVDGWGGKIWFESKEDKGTTFYFTIPLSGMKPRKGEVGITV